MSLYTASYAARYRIPSLLEQIEVAAIKAATDIFNEDPGTADHANRMAWANFVNKSSPTVVASFAWPVAMNPSIQAAIAADPSGSTVTDNDVQFVVNANLDAVIADFVANPPAGSALAHQ
jgi:hypothetical protein